MSKQKIIISDIDQCYLDLSNIEQYFPTDMKSREQWDEYHKYYPLADKVNQPVLNLIKYYQNTGHLIFFMTSREDINNVRRDTKLIIEQNIKPFVLLMRPPNCYDRSVDIKRRLTQDILKDYDVVLAIDDWYPNCKMFKELGIETFMYMQDMFENKFED